MKKVMSVEEVSKQKNEIENFIEEWKNIRSKIDPLIEGWKKYIEEKKKSTS